MRLTDVRQNLKSCIYSSISDAAYERFRATCKCADMSPVLFPYYWIMRNALTLLFLILELESSARSIPADDVDPWKAHFGFMAGMNTSILSMKGGLGPSQTSTMLWTAAFGVYFKSNQKNMYRIEVQSGYVVDGSGREFYYERAEQEFVRIYDRYRTIPLSLILIRNLGWKETISLGLGFRSSFVVSYATRHAGTMQQSGMIFSPKPLRCYGSSLIQLSYNFPNADISLCGWYAVTPVIDQFNVRAAPYGLMLLVKARLFNLRGTKF